MIRGKGLKRLAFIFLFLIPVAWYLFLQLFGSNQFKVEVLQSVPEECFQYQEVTVVLRQDAVGVSQQHYLDRVKYHSDKRKVVFTPDKVDFFSCLANDNDLIIVNNEGIWGSYQLDREGVDQLVTELDILLLQKSYGKGVSR